MNKIVGTLLSLIITASSLAVIAPQYNYASRYSNGIAPEGSVADYEIPERSSHATRPAMVTRPHPAERELSGTQQQYLTPLSEQTPAPARTSTKKPETQNYYHG